MITYQPNNILITGGAGFIGSNFVRYLLERNCAYNNIVNLDALTYAGSLDNLLGLSNPEAYIFVKGDVCDQALIEKLLTRYCIDTIVHFAAETHVDRSILMPGLFVETNIQGTYCLLDAARQYWSTQFDCSPSHCRFYYISTDEVFGSLTNGDAFRKENDCYAPGSPYAASKAAANHLVQAYFNTYRIPTIVSYCTNNYGSYQHHEKFIPMIVNNCLLKKSIPIYGDGDYRRDWLYVEDHCAAIMAILQQGMVGEAYNIAGSNEMSNNELVRLICRLMDKLHPFHVSHDTLVTYVKDRPGHDFRYALNTEKLESTLGWSPRVGLEEGLSRTIQFYSDKLKRLETVER